MAQGREADCPGLIDALVGAPHTWQKRAPGVRLVWQDGHIPPERVVPHELQNLPVAFSPQLGHLVVAGFMLVAF